MKKLYKISVISLVAGLVCMGIGCGVTVCEIKSFKYMGEKYEQNTNAFTKTKEISIPDNLAKIYYDSHYWDEDMLKIEEDTSLEKGKALLVINSSQENVDMDIEVFNSYYLHNMVTDNYSKYAVNYLRMVDYSDYNNQSDMAMLKEFAEDIKNKEIYDYNNSAEVNCVLKVSGEDYERFANLPDEYGIVPYSEYNEEMKIRRSEANDEYEDNYAEEYDEEYYDEDDKEEYGYHDEIAEEYY